MTILEWLVPSMKSLNKAGVDSPRRDCLVLLEDLLGKDRSWVNAHAEFELSDEQIRILSGQIDRRVKREPLAYIRGKAWFYKRFFEVNPNVMVPRPESESFIELLKEIKPKKVIDIGTGSGCLAITAKLELPKSEVIAVDISEDALKVAQNNANGHEANIKFIQSSLFERIDNKDFSQAVVMANLPYVPDGLVTSEEINYEPKIALFSGDDGMDHYRKFWAEINQLEKRPKIILVESLESQHKKMLELAKDSGYKLEKTDILVQKLKSL